MRKMFSALVLALVMAVFVGCGKKEKPVKVDTSGVKTLEEKAGDMAKGAIKQAPAETKKDLSVKTKDHPTK